jgi:hypothetical protein
MGIVKGESFVFCCLFSCLSRQCNTHKQNETPDQLQEIDNREAGGVTGVDLMDTQVELQA